MRATTLYGIADLGRFGLGHRLLAWARCVIWCRQSGAQMLAPNWFGIPVGPWIRKESDKRLYFPLFRSDAYISGLRRLFIVASASRVDAVDLARNTGSASRNTRLVVFRNAVSGDADRFFPTFLGHHELLLRELTRMTRPQFIPRPSIAPHIAIHVRLGDFAKAKPEQVRAGSHNVRLPIEWYGDTLLGVRERLGAQVPAVIYSDGSDSDLDTLLALPQVTRARAGSAITHMLSISQAALLISSGSGMSLWGSFLGQVPRLCFPGQRLLHAFVDDAWEPECESGKDIPIAFANAIRPRLLDVR